MDLVLRGGQVFYRGSLIQADLRLRAVDAASSTGAAPIPLGKRLPHPLRPQQSLTAGVAGTSGDSGAEAGAAAGSNTGADTASRSAPAPNSPTTVRGGTPSHPLMVVQVGANLPPAPADRDVDVSGKLIFPGFADIHVHLREPGFSYKETIRTGTAAAARGGFTAVGAMPNLSPTPDTIFEIREQQGVYQREGLVQVFQYSCLTRGGTGQKVGQEALLDYAALAPEVIGFTDDGFGVQDRETTRLVMQEIANIGGIVAAHTEDLALSADGYINDGNYAHRHGHKGKPKAAEWTQLQRDLELVEETGCAYHACHISCRESVDLVRAAKAKGLPVTCETAPHYLALWDDLLEDEGRFRMNPPIRAKDDREALVEALVDGTIDMVATDHAPHSHAEKAGGLAESANGVVGLEHSVPVIYTHFVETGAISVPEFVRLMSVAPRERFQLGGGEIQEGIAADLIVFDPNFAAPLDPELFLSKGKATPFAGHMLRGRVEATFCQGVLAWDETGAFTGTKVR